MNILIVHAHPESKSFSGALRDTAADFFKSSNCNVAISDLYSMNFNPVGSPRDLKETSTVEYFDYQKEQLYGIKNNLLTDEIKNEMAKFLKADLIIYNFPLWWFSVPAIMKGWFDRVFAMGFAYGPGKGVYSTGTFRNKTSFLCITTGGAEFSYKESGVNGDINKILFHVNHGMLNFVGMKVLPPFVVYGPSTFTEEEKKSKLIEYRNYLSKLNNIKPLFY
ncbi:MAG: NAD(P)H-dependent oxidoreductase [Ignavibacteria bacterium]|nr:NAD(P)H-dependent oxidoreductase [Ignavibacteria bacterium]